MKSNLKLSVWIMLCLAVGLIAGCVSHAPFIPPSPPTPPSTPTTPSWRQLQSGIYTTSEGRFFYGVGRADGVNNPTLLRATADNDARDQLSNVFAGYIAELEKSPNLKADPYWMAISEDERQLVLGTLARQSLQQAALSDHWRDGQQPEWFSLCRLNIETLKKTVVDSPSLDATTRAVILTEIDAVFNRLAQ